MHDVITIGESMITLSPSVKGRLKFAKTFEKKVGGAELNVAIGCSRLGLHTGWISRLGKDDFGEYILNFARGEGVDVSQIGLVNDYPTSLNFKEIKADGTTKTIYYRHKSPILTLRPEDLDESYIKQAKILHLTGIYPAINPVNIPVMERAIDLAKQHGVKVSLDPNIRLRMWSKEEAREVLRKLLPKVDILLAGDEEMDIIIGEKDPKRIISEVKEIGVSFIAIKQGDKGSVGYYNGEIVEAPAIKASNVIDTVGAGDGFDAGILYGIVQNWPLEKTLTFANAIGSMVVSVVGDNEGLPSYEEVLEKLGKKEFIER
ncbi:2-keto-3-deoxygluconate kinase [Oceanobacillus arenosus]|uniref:2-keto-3-deoxygluconate kinase n=1 Tax=Oceanobacillus arenosus TaxID=1229153 RepID=A0A3D8Q134_9BACI|nr:sugar kinase [Oceanobacillus arenosus]RDW22150.1 2-keto-3-deoxygluconate kinase [Oceanobacillus arenosus]